MEKPLMKTSIAAIALTALLAWGGPAEAQSARSNRFGPRDLGTWGTTVSTTPGVVYSSGYVVPPAYPTVAVKPYSYYVLPSSVPSREYVGPAEFPFYGRPYGYPYDRWTWSYMSTAGYGPLVRYYYPPLGF
jgi:hypothetical protein